MIKRVSKVDNIKLNTLTSASQLQIGDAKEIHLTLNALAMLRDTEIWFDHEGDLKNFPIFNRPTIFPALYEALIVKTNNVKGKIEVGKVNILGVASSSLIQIGSNECMKLESRIKHIRHLTIPPNENSNELKNDDER